MWQAKFIRRSVGILLICALTLCSCGDQTKTGNKDYPTPVSPKDPPPDELEKEFPFLTTDDARVALKTALTEGNYRIARAGDFQFSDKAREALKTGDLEKWVKDPIIITDINHDNMLVDFAVMVVDAKGDQKRWSLLIFNQPTTVADEYKPFWLIKDRDLSHTLISRRVGEVYANEISDDGTINTCQVVWDKVKATYTCQEQKK